MIFNWLPGWALPALLFLGGALGTYFGLKGWYPVQKEFWGSMYDSSKWAGVAIIALSALGLIIAGVVFGLWLNGPHSFAKAVPSLGYVLQGIFILTLAVTIYASSKTRDYHSPEIKWARVLTYTLIGVLIGMAVPAALFLNSTYNLLKIAPFFKLTPLEPVARSGPVTFLECYEPYYHFHVLMPELRRPIVGVKSGWIYEQKEGSYAVEVYALPHSYDPSRYDERLNDYCNLEVGNMEGTETHNTQIALNGVYPGREVEGKITSKEKLFRFRFYIVKGYAFCTLVEGEPQWVSSPDAFKFLDSFKPSS